MGITDGASLLVTHVNLHYFQVGYQLRLQIHIMIFMKAYISLSQMCSNNIAQLTHAISFHISLPPPLPAGKFGNIT